MPRFIAYIGIAYHLPGSFSGERANLLTSHLKAMGLKDSARIMWVDPSTFAHQSLIDREIVLGTSAFLWLISPAGLPWLSSGNFAFSLEPM